MGKHKMKKSKKPKKVKRSKQTRHNSPESDSSESNDGEIVWTESGAAESMPVLPPVKSMLEPKEPTSESNTDEDDGEKRDGNDWLSHIEQKSKGNVKLAHLKRDIRKKEQEKADNKIRYTRELNSYYRDDVNKKFIDDPDNFWKTKTKAMETDSEGDSADDGAPTNDREYDDKGQNDKPVSAAKRLTNAERNALNAKIIKAEMFNDIELANQLKAKLKEAESCSGANEEEIQYYSKSKMSKTEQTAAEEKMTVKELYFQAKSITTRDEAMRFVASSSKLRTNPIYDDEYDEVKGKKKKPKVHHDGFERIRSQDDQTESCGDCLEKMGKHLVLRFSVPELKHCYVCFTPYEPFTSNYCHIRSRSHGANNSVSADEECWTELRQVMRLLSSFFSQYYKCCVLFMETHFLHQKRSQNYSRRHFVIDCIPLKERYEADARIYFHKAIMECGEEWSTNKKMIKLDGKPVTKMIPKGMAYFWVSFGANFNGFAHVIEDEDYFSKDFGKETIACLTKNHNFKRPRSQDYDSQMKRIGEAKDNWQSFIQNH